MTLLTFIWVIIKHRGECTTGIKHSGVVSLHSINVSMQYLEANLYCYKQSMLIVTPVIISSGKYYLKFIILS